MLMLARTHVVPPHPPVSRRFFYWINEVQTYSVRGTAYMDLLKAWVDGGMATADTGFLDAASGIVNRGCHDAPFEGSHGHDPCGNGEIHGHARRRKNFKHIWDQLKRGL